MIICLLIIGLNCTIRAQIPDTALSGEVTYITSQHIYVRFQSTEGITAGDTLFKVVDGLLIPHAVVKELSSKSCVCTPFQGVTSKEKMILMATKLNRSSELTTPALTSESSVTPSSSQPLSPAPIIRDTIKSPPGKRQSIHGYFSVSSYSGFSSEPNTNQLRMKYTLALNAMNIGSSDFSAECYINFNHRDNAWSEIADDIFNGLKIYNLAVKYDNSKRLSVLLGRKINPRLSNMGANDGLQAEIRFKPLSVGLIAGFRPDYQNYGFNANLLQFGAYVYNEFHGRNGTMQSTVAFVQQSNSGRTDRRFLYLQHVNALVKNLMFFASVEADLYRMTLNTTDSTYQPENTISLSNLYFSVNWSILKSLSLTAIYSARNNVVYYETYKSYLDRLLDTELLQGYAVNISYRPVKLLSVGVNGAWRFRPSDPRDTRNLHLYVTYASLPALDISVTGSLTLLETGYLSGKVYSLGVSRDFLKSRISPSLTYRYVDYTYNPGGLKQPQNLLEASLAWKIYRKIFFSVYYEGTFEKVDQFNRLYARLNLGF